MLVCFDQSCIQRSLLQPLTVVTAKKKWHAKIKHFGAFSVFTFVPGNEDGGMHMYQSPTRSSITNRPVKSINIGGIGRSLGSADVSKTKNSRWRLNRAKGQATAMDKVILGAYFCKMKLRCSSPVDRLVQNSHILSWVSRLNFNNTNG